MANTWLGTEVYLATYLKDNLLSVYQTNREMAFNPKYLKIMSQATKLRGFKNVLDSLYLGHVFKLPFAPTKARFFFNELFPLLNRVLFYVSASEINLMERARGCSCVWSMLCLSGSLSWLAGVVGVAPVFNLFSP